MSKKHVWWAAAVALVGSQAMAQEGVWLTRLRAVQLDMHNDNGTSIASLGVNHKVMGEVDVSYFFNPEVAAELSLTLPQRQVMRDSTGAIGGFEQLPAILTLQYHFNALEGVKPYIGLGMHYTRFSGVGLDGGYSLDTSHTGGVLQIGMDFPLDKKWSLNVDVKKAYIRTDVYSSAGANLGTLKLDPTMLGVGLGYRF